MSFRVADNYRLCAPFQIRIKKFARVPIRFATRRDNKLSCNIAFNKMTF